MPPKTVCPISRDDFDKNAQAVEITINGEAMKVPVKVFSTGSLGWYLNKKMDIKVGGVPVSVQIGLNMTIVGSKDLKPKEAAAPAVAAVAAAPAHHESDAPPHPG